MTALRKDVQTSMFVAGFDNNAQLRIGLTTAWVTETIGATANYLEFKGDGLATFERALDRVERLLAVQDCWKARSG